MLSALRALAPTTAAPTLGLSHQDFAWYWCTTPPNESRVSRAAWRIKSSFLDHTPRRLQALVRQPPRRTHDVRKPKNRRPRKASQDSAMLPQTNHNRSEERRVGKECRSR